MGDRLVGLMAQQRPEAFSRRARTRLIDPTLAAVMGQEGKWIVGWSGNPGY